MALIDGKPSESATFSVEAVVIHDRRYSQGSLHLCIDGVTASDDDGNEIYHVRLAIGGVIDIEDVVEGKTWSISPKDLVNAIEARKAATNVQS